MSKIKWVLDPASESASEENLQLAVHLPDKALATVQQWQHDTAGCLRTMRYLAQLAKQSFDLEQSFDQQKAQSIDKHLAFLEGVYRDLCEPIGKALVAQISGSSATSDRDHGQSR